LHFLKWLWKWYLRIVSPCPEWVDQMRTPIGGGDDGDGRRWRSTETAVMEGDGEGVDYSEYTWRGHRWCRIVPEVMQPCEYGLQGQRYVEHYNITSLIPSH
jgi:hypothetical protein